jgi:hypothetical protein
MGENTNSQQPGDASEARDDENAARRLSVPVVGDAFMSAVILRPREPFLNWVRQHLKPEAASLDSEVAAPAVAITPELPRAADQDAWLRQHSDDLFARQLEVWAAEASWPTDRSLEALRAWFDVEFVPAVDDLRAYHVHPEVTCAPISLAEMVDQFETLFDQGAVFVDISSGTIVALSASDMDAIAAGDAAAIGIAEEDLETMRLAYESPSLVEVMSRHDFDEFAAMESFADSMPSASIRNRLLNALRGRKPFRRFKETVYEAGIRDKWFAWRHAAVAEAVTVALEDCQIPYVDDLGPHDTAECRDDTGPDSGSEHR